MRFLIVCSCIASLAATNPYEPRDLNGRDTRHERDKKSSGPQAIPTKKGLQRRGQCLGRPSPKREPSGTFHIRRPGQSPPARRPGEVRGQFECIGPNSLLVTHSDSKQQSYASSRTHTVHVSDRQNFNARIMSEAGGKHTGEVQAGKIKLYPQHETIVTTRGPGGFRTIRNPAGDRRPIEVSKHDRPNPTLALPGNPAFMRFESKGIAVNRVAVQQRR